MFCMVNCNENAYIANYRKMGKPLEYKRNTNERVKLSTFPPIVIEAKVSRCFDEIDIVFCGSQL